MESFIFSIQYRSIMRRCFGHPIMSVQCYVFSIYINAIGVPLLLVTVGGRHGRAMWTLLPISSCCPCLPRWSTTDGFWSAAPTHTLQLS